MRFMNLVKASIVVILLVIAPIHLLSSYRTLQSLQRYYPFTSWSSTEPESNAVSTQSHQTGQQVDTFTDFFTIIQVPLLWQRNHQVRWHLTEETRQRDGGNVVRLFFVLCSNPWDQVKTTLWHSQYNNNNSNSTSSNFIQPYTYILSPNFMGTFFFYTNIMQDFLKDILDHPKEIPWVGAMPSHVYASDLFSPAVVHPFFQTHQSKSEVQVMAFGGWGIHPDNLQKPYWEEHEHCCPGLLYTFKSILLSSGENEDNILTFVKSSTHVIPSFSHSSFMIRSALLPDYIQWLSNVWIFILTDPLVQQSVWTNCKYSTLGSQNDTIHELPGHVLLGDWLAAYYFTSRGYIVQRMTEFPQSNGVTANVSHSGSPNCAIASNRLEPIFILTDATKNAIQQRIPYNSAAVVFILCYDKECETQIQEEKRVLYPWMYPIVLPKSSYMGDPLLFTRKYLGELVNLKSSNIPWIGTIPHHFLLQGSLDLAVVQEMIMDEGLQKDEDVHVLGFWNPFLWSNLPTILSGDHPGLWELLEYALVSVGERKEDIDTMHSFILFKAFYGLAFVARPHVVIEFMEWLSRVILFLFSDPKAHNIIWSQNIEPQAVISILGERLAPYFMNTRGFNIIKNAKEYKNFVHKREVLVQCQSERFMVPDGLGEGYDVSIFYHIGMANNWKDLVLEQMEKMEVCGLGHIAHDMTISFSNPSPKASVLDSTREIRALLYQYDFAAKLTKVTFVDADLFPYESRIMESIAALCHASHESDRKNGKKKKRIVFYFHDKGCSRYSATDDGQAWEYNYVNEWRTYMEAFLLDRPSLCIRAIMNHDAYTCGVNRNRNPYFHYSGNFWTASCDYIVDLPATKDKWRPNDQGFLDFWYTKIGAELWIGNFTNETETDSVTSHRHMSLFNIAANLYSTYAEFELYQWIFDDVSLYISGKKNSTVVIEQSFADTSFDSGNLTALWLDYNNSRSSVTRK